MNAKTKERKTRIFRARDSSSNPRQRLRPAQSKYQKVRALTWVTFLIGIITFVTTYALATMLYDPAIPIPEGGWFDVVFVYGGIPIFPHGMYWGLGLILVACLFLAPIAGMYKPNE